MKRFIICILIAQLAVLFSPASADVACIESDGTISVSVDGKPVLTYQKSTRESPEGIDPLYRRSGYIHSVHNPAGHKLTGDFPADHPHQHALFFAWRQVNFEGRQTDFWDQKSERGRTSHDAVVAVKSGKRSGGFTVKLLHEDLTGPRGPIAIIRETWTVTVFDRDDAASEGAFIFDLELEQTNVTDSPITIEKYHYGGMALRGDTSWLTTETDAADFLTSEGKNRSNGNHSRPKWVDMFGPVDGKLAGISVLSHAGNFRHPQPVRLHPSKPYFSFSPMVESEFNIEAGKKYRARYRYIAHNGAPDAASIDAEWNAFSKKDP